ncbi:hypothetical protein [Methylobacterium sp. Leaf113]|uniref:hypothetical protein n=1 Tax=Methylobacterium sp. Leaf113 TaxID=1736259 RepID=UPI000A79C44A|nr:hypothetical protein [Methylobacterium sp. Leaf113]
MTSTLKRLARSSEPSSFDATPLDPVVDEGIRTFKPTRHTPFVPVPRGNREPAFGSVDDPTVLRDLALGGHGWLHRDGRLVSNGSLYGASALRALPETAVVLERLDGELIEVKAARQREWDVALADHVAGGGTEDDFHDDHATQELSERIDEDNPDPDIKRALENVGWVAVTLRRDYGTKEVVCDFDRKDVPVFEDHLRKIAGHFQCRLDGTVKHSVDLDQADEDDLGRNPAP